MINKHATMQRPQTDCEVIAVGTQEYPLPYFLIEQVFVFTLSCTVLLRDEGEQHDNPFQIANEA